MSADDPNASLDRIEQAAQVLLEDKRNSQCDRTFNYRTQGAKILAEVRALRAALAVAVAQPTVTVEISEAGNVTAHDSQGQPVPLILLVTGRKVADLPSCYADHIPCLFAQDPDPEALRLKVAKARPGPKIQPEPAWPPTMEPAARIVPRITEPQRCMQGWLERGGPCGKVGSRACPIHLDGSYICGCCEEHACHRLPTAP